MHWPVELCDERKRGNDGDCGVGYHFQEIVRSTIKESSEREVSRHVREIVASCKAETLESMTRVLPKCVE